MHIGFIKRLLKCVTNIVLLSRLKTEMQLKCKRMTLRIRLITSTLVKIKNTNAFKV